MNRLVLFLSVLALVSCDLTRVYDVNKPLREAVWNSGSPMDFFVEIKDATKKHNLYFNLRNDQNYKYNNLYVLSTLTTPSGVVESDTLEFILCDQTGKWLGNSSGSLVTHQILFQRNLTFPTPGTYSLTFNQLMRDEKLVGIKEVGLRVETAN